MRMTTAQYFNSNLAAWLTPIHNSHRLLGVLCASLGSEHCMRCREERLEFYRQHDIGFVARPPHGKAGFVRAGRFKKASNMNYCLEISRQVETIMQVVLSPS